MEFRPSYARAAFSASEASEDLEPKLSLMSDSNNCDEPSTSSSARLRSYPTRSPRLVNLERRAKFTGVHHASAYSGLGCNRAGL